jgi:hypothetical protein
MTQMQRGFPRSAFICGLCVPIRLQPFGAVKVRKAQTDCPQMTQIFADAQKISLHLCHLWPEQIFQWGFALLAALLICGLSGRVACLVRT